MTLVHAVVVAAALIALLMLLKLIRMHARQASARSDASMNLDIDLSQPRHENCSCSTRAGATVEHRTFGPPSEQAGAGEVPSSRPSSPQTRPSLRARLAIFSAARLRRSALRRSAQHAGEKSPHAMSEASHAAARALPQDDQFLNMLKLLPFAVLMTNRHGEIVLANAVTEKLFGYSRDALIGACADLLMPAWGANFHAVQPAEMMALPPIRPVGGTCDLVARREDGTEFPAEITANPISSNGEQYTLTVVIDRTERYELRRNRQELAHLTRVSTLGELAGSLAHELNQPLTAILSNVQAAQRFMSTQPINLTEVREILQDLVADNHRAGEVIRKIRALVKKGDFEATPLSLASVIGDVALLVHSDAIVRGIRVLLTISPELPPVHGDRVQVQQVVLNLLLNAFDALESRSTHDRVVIVEATHASAGMLRIAVRDRGIGLDRDKLDKLFIPFFTSKREGLGLGLSISRSIVEMHGGRIWAENNQDQGATFYFTLPTGAAAKREHSLHQP